MKTDINYLFEGCTGLVAFSITYTSEQGKSYNYTSPFVFENTDDAYHAACIELSGK